MQEAAIIEPGGMAAIMDLEEEKIREICTCRSGDSEHKLRGAGHNHGA